MPEFHGKHIFLYTNFFKDDYSIGITKKIHAQIKSLRKLGFLVTYSSYSDDGALIIDNDENIVFKKKYPIDIKKLNRYYRRFHLIKTVIQYLSTEQCSFDYAYLRWHTYDRLFLRMLKTLKDRGAVNIVEAHAYSPDFVPTSLISKYQVFMDNRYAKRAKDYVDLVAAMTTYKDIWGIPTVQIENAIDLDDISPREYSPDLNGTVRLISVAIERNYHGIDRVLRGLHNYYKSAGAKRIQFLLVGKYTQETIELVNSLGLRDICSFVGSKSGAELDRLYNHADIGVGALAHHRIGMYEGSSLKTKEYFAKGLPFIYGWKEPSFDDTYPYALRFELCEDPIDIRAVLDFFQHIENEDYLTEMRDFAANNYSWDREFTKLFSAFEKRM